MAVEEAISHCLWHYGLLSLDRHPSTQRYYSRYHSGVRFPAERRAPRRGPTTYELPRSSHETTEYQLCTDDHCPTVYGQYSMSPLRDAMHREATISPSSRGKLCDLYEEGFAPVSLIWLMIGLINMDAKVGVWARIHDAAMDVSRCAGLVSDDARAII